MSATWVEKGSWLCFVAKLSIWWLYWWWWQYRAIVIGVQKVIFVFEKIHNFYELGWLLVSIYTPYTPQATLHPIILISVGLSENIKRGCLVSPVISYHNKKSSCWSSKILQCLGNLPWRSLPRGYQSELRCSTWRKCFINNLPVFSFL